MATLFEAAHANNAALVGQMLAAGANPEGSDARGPPLTAAATGGHLEVVRLLLARGANVNASNAINGVSPLFISSYMGHGEVVRELLAHGATASQAVHDGTTPLHASALCGHAGIAAMLLAAGADVNARNRIHLTPLALAMGAAVDTSAVQDLLLAAGGTC